MFVLAFVANRDAQYAKQVGPLGDMLDQFNNISFKDKAVTVVGELRYTSLNLADFFKNKGL